MKAWQWVKGIRLVLGHLTVVNANVLRCFVVMRHSQCKSLRFANSYAKAGLFIFSKKIYQRPILRTGLSIYVCASPSHH